MSGLIRPWKESEAARGTHQLKITKRDIYQDMESRLEKHPYFLNRTKEGLLGHGKKGTSEVHSLARESRDQDWLGHKKKASQQWALTSWRRQRLGLVRTQKESKQAKATCFLEREKVITHKDSKPARDTHNLEGSEVKTV